MMFLTRGEDRAGISRPPGQGMCQTWLGPVSGLYYSFQATFLQGGVGAACAGAEERTLLTRARWEHPSLLSGSQVSLSCLSTKPKLCWVACRLAAGWPVPHGDALTQGAPPDREWQQSQRK